MNESGEDLVMQDADDAWNAHKLGIPKPLYVAKLKPRVANHANYYAFGYLQQNGSLVTQGFGSSIDSSRIERVLKLDDVFEQIP